MDPGLGWNTQLSYYLAMDLLIRGAAINSVWTASFANIVIPLRCVLSSVLTLGLTREATWQVALALANLAGVS